MGSVTSRVSQNASLAFVEHDPGNSEETWQLVFSAMTNGAGTATTVVDSQRASGSANTFNGRYWVRMTGGANKGLWKRIVDDNGTGTLTLEGAGFPAAPGTLTGYEIWKSPEPVVVVTSAASGLSFADTARDEADDFWNGYYIVALSGALRGEKSEITDFASASGTFTVGTAFSAAPSAGDVFALRQYVDAKSVNNGLSQAFNERPVHRLDGSRGDGSVGVKSGTFGFDAPALPAYKIGSTVVQPPLGGLIKACGFKLVNSNLATGSAMASGSTTTQIELDTGTWEDFSIGTVVNIRGEQAYITALADGAGSEDNMTISPALGVAPGVLTAMWRTINYRRNRRADDGDYGCVTIVHEVDGIRTTMTGCKGNLTISGDADLTFSFEFQVDHFIREYAPAAHYSGDAYDSYTPIQATERRCYFGATAVELGGISASLGNTVVPRKVQGGYGINGRAGFGHSAVNPGLTARKLMSTASGEELDHDERWFSRTSQDLMIFWGTKVLGGCALRIPVARLVAEPKPEDDEGLQVTPFVFEAMDAGTTTDPDGTVVKIPDFIISFS